MSTTTTHTPGCYVDGSRGIYAVDRIVEIAQEHGMSEPDCPCTEHGAFTILSQWAGCEFVNEVEDECDTYMNEHHAVEGHYWGRSEQGDWGLWEVEEG